MNSSVEHGFSNQLILCRYRYQYLNPLLKSIANPNINKSLLRDSKIFTLASLSKTCSSLGNEFSSFGKPSVQMQQMLTTLPCGSIWYRTIPILDHPGTLYWQYRYLILGTAQHYSADHYNASVHVPLS